jgi:hypothetical protein
MSTRAERQEEYAAKLVSDAADVVRALIATAARALDAGENSGCDILAADHTAKVNTALQEADLSEHATDKYDAKYVHQTLKLELAPTDLVSTGEAPKYEELKVVLKALDALLEERGIYGPYRDLIERKKAELLEVERSFLGSQVDIDEMDHEGFHKAVDALKRVVLMSCESVVEKLSQDADVLVARYQEIVHEELAAYEREAAVVESASPARMRPVRKEDDEDPWQAPPAPLGMQYESEALQRYIDSERHARVADIYEKEWTLERRRDVSRLVGRAEHVSLELDEHLYAKAVDVLARLADISDAKVAKVQETLSASDSVAAEILRELRASVELIQQAGAAYQARKREQRLASERDLGRLAAYVDGSQRDDVNYRAAYENKQANTREWLKSNEEIIADRVAKIVALQKEVAQLASTRQAVADDLLEAALEERRRQSRHREINAQCQRYEAMLRVSMRNFLLPDNYSNVLGDFAVNCEALANDRFASENAALDRMLKEAAAEAHVTRSSAFAAPRLMVFRYKQRVDDILAKAAMARDMRDFCTQTKDPNLQQHAATETELDALALALEKHIPPLQRASDENREKYQRLVPLLDRCAVPRTHRDLDSLFFALLDEDEAYVARASRPPLVDLVLPGGSAGAAVMPHLVVPPVHHATHMVDRAVKAHGAVRQFA